MTTSRKNRSFVSLPHKSQDAPRHQLALAQDDYTSKVCFSAGHRFILNVFSISASLSMVISAEAQAVTPKDIHFERELLITAPEVVDSDNALYPGPWSFGGLMEQLEGADAQKIVGDWLQTWNAKQIINNQEVHARFGIYDKVIRPWQIRDHYKPDGNTPWLPNFANAPFRLLAIVNRMDLCAPEVANTTQDIERLWKLQGRLKEFQKLTLDPLSSQRPLGYGASFCFGAVRQAAPAKKTFGEGRFVFCGVDDKGAPLAGGWTIILEYHLLSADNDPRTWASRWHDLGRFDLKDPAYLDALENVTNAFTAHGNSELSQLRSNEAAFGPGREFRQFSHNAGLHPDLLTETPGPAFAENFSPEQKMLSQFVHERQDLIRYGLDLTPNTIGSTPFLAGNAIIPGDTAGFYWTMNRHVAPEARRLFSLNTCNGCHGSEAGSRTGVHIQPREAGKESLLSDFIRRDGVPLRTTDPESKSLVTYNEMNDRAAILAALLHSSDTSTLDALRPILRERLSRAH